MPRGLPRSYIKKASRELGKGASWSSVFKRAWQLYKGSKVHQAIKGSRNPKSKKTKRRGGFEMTKKKRRYKRSMTIPLAPIIGFLGTPAVTNAIPHFMQGNWEEGFHYMKNLVGLWRDGSFHFDTLISNMTPIIIGLLAHKFIGGSPLNLNRTLARHKIPLIRI